ncbi:MAG TPA: tungstate ABC transporter substrate-binding protein WtpA [Spirochaetota bacterium]|nr:tungstate ABC transporter substrate-binding protein WtpA [Spirochaetota bacterium]HPI87836.1 tungstate ABC transporter substrate-binding protein WtpA [Spirochaetota bacterium]HPR47432.1 tungstate ABC transporter substrate-binding protein WtpA [Spirochaetota bacterium]
MKRFVLLLIVLSVAVTSCKKEQQSVIIFHAGSLAVPMKELKKEFEAENPGFTLLLESSGSRDAARKVSDLGKPCDIVASADYVVIKDLLMPEYADYIIRFATNEMALVHTAKSKYADSINAENWPDILLKSDVSYGHSDPEKDPCGYRSQLVWKLAEKHYERPGLYMKLKNAMPRKNIRPKEVDLIALIETGVLDYIFLYRSVAIQHALPFVELPPEINLGSPEHENFYNSVSIDLTGKKPGEKNTVRGEAMVYGLTMVKNPANRPGAIKFLSFMLEQRTLELFKKLGQAPIVPPVCAEYDRVPEELRGLVSPLK